ncbi:MULTISPECIES: hypothetical protein [unclassified Microcoleus]|uniref:hypothetical protein n=1 Tax=unclassified Microcoleus TaxID=2642155 RepID=UPI002FD62D77
MVYSFGCCASRAIFAVRSTDLTEDGNLRSDSGLASAGVAVEMAGFGFGAGGVTTHPKPIASKD